jgi:hypothetical protein
MRWKRPRTQDILNRAIRLSLIGFFGCSARLFVGRSGGAQGDHRAFDKLSSAAASLAEVRTRLVEMRLWTLGIKDYLGRVDPECARSMAETYPHLKPDELITCTKRLLAEYERIGPAYCQKTGVSYPDHKVAVMYNLMAEFEQLH